MFDACMCLCAFVSESPFSDGRGFVCSECLSLFFCRSTDRKKDGEESSKGGRGGRRGGASSSGASSSGGGGSRDRKGSFGTGALFNMLDWSDGKTDPGKQGSAPKDGGTSKQVTGLHFSLFCCGVHFVWTGRVSPLTFCLFIVCVFVVTAVSDGESDGDWEASFSQQVSSKPSREVAGASKPASRSSDKRLVSPSSPSWSNFLGGGMESLCLLVGFASPPPFLKWWHNVAPSFPGLKLPSQRRKDRDQARQAIRLGGGSSSTTQPAHRMETLIDCTSLESCALTMSEDTSCDLLTVWGWCCCCLFFCFNRVMMGCSS